MNTRFLTASVPRNALIPFFSFGQVIQWYLYVILSSLLLGIALLVSAAYVPLVGISKVAAGSDHACALTNSGGVKCWGHNNLGQLGNGSFVDSLTAVNVSGLISGVADIAVGYAHSCAVTISGDVKCWGGNNDGQLGNNSTTDSPIPVVSGLTSGVAIGVGAGDYHTCALTTGGGVKCWGGNSLGANGTGAPSLTPVDVSGLTSGVSAIGVMSFGGCALISGGMQCWGENIYGQLGDGSTADHLAPVVSTLTTDVSAMAVDRYHACALLISTGGIKCWGLNDSGQLGDSFTTDRSTPDDVSGLTSGVAAIAVGYYHSCALTPGGGMKCWGKNDYGQLGDGTTTNRLTWVNSSFASGVSTVAMAFGYTCAVMTAGGGVKCWGYNNYGKLGNNTTTDSLTPVDVLIDDTPPTATGVSISLDPGIPLRNVGEVLTAILIMKKLAAFDGFQRSGKTLQHKIHQGIPTVKIQITG